MQSWIFVIKRIRFWVEACLDRIFDGFSVRRCFACKRAVAETSNGFFCSDCYPKLNVDFAETRKEINFTESELKFLLGKSDFYYPKVYYSQKYTDLNKFLLREFKYRRPYYGAFVGKCLADYLSQNVNYILADAPADLLARTTVQDGTTRPLKLWLTAVPMHRDKFLRRSYNQADILARKFYDKFAENFARQDFTALYQSRSGLAWHAIADMEYLPDLLLRVKNTGSLYDKSRQERIELMSASLRVNPGLDLELDSSYENILLVVDDIVTTGATCVACYRAILESNLGFDEVVCLALAGN